MFNKTKAATSMQISIQLTPHILASLSCSFNTFFVHTYIHLEISFNCFNDEIDNFPYLNLLLENVFIKYSNAIVVTFKGRFRCSQSRNFEFFLEKDATREAVSLNIKIN